MKKALLLFLINYFMFCSIAKADRPFPRQGEVTRYYSDNKKYEIGIIEQTVTDSPCEAIFRKDRQIIWQKKLNSTPGAVSISNNGKYVVLANWGWADEGGFKSISFYKGNGDLIKELPFGAAGSFKSIGGSALSGDGHYYVYSELGGKQSRIVLYDVFKIEKIWEKSFGFAGFDKILLSQNGRYMLMATHNQKCIEEGCNPINPKPKDVRFSYIDNSGEILWEKVIEDGFKWYQDFIQLSDDGLSFKIFDAKQNKWIEFLNKGGIVQ